jgi:Ceramidase
MVPFLIGLAESAVAIGALFLFGALDWIKSSCPDKCFKDNVDTCYCEQVRPGKMIKQRSNTWSNLGFVLVGLIMLASLPAVVAGSGRDPLEERTFYAVLYGCVVIFLGPGSMFFHASMKKWGGWIDTLSMILYTAFLLVYDITGIFNGGKALFLIVFLVLVAGLGVLTWFVPDSPLPHFSMGALAFGSMAVLWALLQFFAILGIGGIDRENGPALLLFIAGAIVFGVAFLIQQRSATGKPWCQPESVVQGHAIWHLLTAATTVILFFYLRTEIGAR